MAVNFINLSKKDFALSLSLTLLGKVKGALYIHKYSRIENMPNMLYRVSFDALAVIQLVFTLVRFSGVGV